MKYKRVTADEWADFCSSFRTYASEDFEGEDYHSVMYDKLAQGPLVGEIIGVVHYHHDGTPCRAYKRFSYLHGAEVGVADVSQGLPQDKAQSLVDAWNGALRRANRGGRYYLDTPDSTALWPDVA